MDLVIRPVQGDRAHARFPLILLVLLLSICVVTAWAPPAGLKNWLLEVTPGLAIVFTLAAIYKRFPVSHLVYGCVFVHVLILIYGGIYSYAHTPLGDWAKETFHLARNHYDRIGHLAFGFFPVLLLREVLLRVTPLRPGGWLTFIMISMIFGFAAVWELIEWWTTLIVASDLGQAFLGTQGDVWDAQWDMFLAGVGASISLAVMSRWHDRSMARLMARAG
jgi:putative membrane protein